MVLPIGFKPTSFTRIFAFSSGLVAAGVAYTTTKASVAVALRWLLMACC